MLRNLGLLTPRAPLPPAQGPTRAFRDAPFDVGAEEPIPVILSLGIACFPDDGTSARTVLDMADRAMYRAKNQARDRWHAAVR